jgi:small subunit ribosomal protein S18
MADKEDIDVKKDDDRDEASSSGRDSSRDRRPARRSSNRRFSRRRQRQTVPAYVDWKDVEFLERFIPERGKIMPRRISGVSAKDQRRVARAIKRARVMALIPYVSD